MNYLNKGDCVSNEKLIIKGILSDLPKEEVMKFEETLEKLKSVVDTESIGSIMAVAMLGAELSELQ